MAPRSQLFTAALALALVPHAPILASAAENESDMDQGDDLGPEDMLSPPSCEFIDERNRPKFRLRPAGGKGGDKTWTVLSFEAVDEVDAQGKKVSSRSIRLLQELDGFETTQESREVGGVMSNVTKVAVGLSFNQSCNGTELESPAGVGGTFAIETFLFPPNTTANVTYGSGSVYVFPGQIKFNIESTSWPFCSEENKLRVRMNVRVKGQKGGKGMAKRFSEWTDDDSEDWMKRAKSGKRENTKKTKDGKSGKGKGLRGTSDYDDDDDDESEESQESQESEESEQSEKSEESDKRGDDDEESEESEGEDGDRKGVQGRMSHGNIKGKRFILPAGEFDIDMDLPSVVLADGAEAACEVELEDSDKELNVDFTFPHFAESLVYDPVPGFADPSETDDADDYGQRGEELGLAASMDLARAPALGATAAAAILFGAAA